MENSIDLKWLNENYKPLYNQAFDWAFKITENREDAEDSAQESMISLWKNLDKYRPELGFNGWFSTIVRRKAIDIMRKRSAYSKILEERAESLPGEAERIDISEDEYVCILLEELPRMDSKFGNIIIDNYLRGLSHQQLADKYGLSLGCIKSRCKDGRMKLEKMLRERGLE